MKRNAGKWIGVFLLLSLLVTGCGGKTEEITEKQTICVVLKAMDSVHWMSVEDGLKQAANDYGVSVNILWPANENDVDTQNTILEDVIASKPDAIAVSPCDSEQVDILDQAQQADIPCFYIDTKAKQFDFPYIGADNYNIGKVAAMAFEEYLDGGKVAVIMGNPKQSTHAERLQGFTDYIEQHTDIEICETEVSETSSYLESMKCMEAICQQNPDAQGIFCTSALMVLGAMQQLEDTGTEDIALIGVDMQSDAMSSVEEGKILALVGQNGYEIGYQTIRTIVQSLDGGEIEQNTYVDTPLITQENVAEYLEKYLTERGEGND
ncbi:MAG: substrate-binding domain-containing protein [Eubacteriales bacterium]|nr:substrate-binding domain-containing protein [Eubacteriales bacterium]